MITSLRHFALAILLCLLTAGNTFAAPAKPAELFDQNKVWTLHLIFTPEQWQAIEPKSGGGPWGQPRPPVPKFDLGKALAPTFLVQGDLDHDGKLSSNEFTTLSEKWFAAWDIDKKQTLTPIQLRTGINQTFAGTRGPGPRPNPIGINLQGQGGKRNGLSAAFGTEFPTVHADLQFDDLTLKDVAVRYKGNGTFMEARSTNKRSFKIDVGKFVLGQNLAGIVTLNLHNCITDASLMNEVLSHRLFREAGVPSPRTAYARVYVTVAGKYDRQYFGLYSLVENIDAHFTKERFGKKGTILKPVTPELFADLGDDWKNYTQTYDPKTSPPMPEAQRLIDLCKFATYAADDQFIAHIGDYLDLDEVARFLAVTVYLSDLDGILGPGQNLYLYFHPKTHKINFIPWDQDHSFGQFSMVGNQQQREQLSIHHPWRLENRFLDRLFKSEAFKSLYLAKLDEFSQSLFKPQRFADQVDQIAAGIREAVKEEGEIKLQKFDKAVAGTPIPTGGFSFLTGEAMKPIRSFVKVRTQSVQDQLAGKFKGEQIDAFKMRMTPPADLFFPLQLIDANKDNQITHEEFAAAFKAWFKDWDTNSDNLLSPAELQAALNGLSAPLKALLHN